MAGKIRSSRILKVTLIVVISLIAVWAVSTGMIFYLTWLATTKSITPEQITLIQYVADLLKVDIVGAITTVVSFCIARYGLRETAANITGNRMTDTTSAEK